MSDENNSPTSPISPLAPYPPVPSGEYRSRAPEFYGFVAWTSTSLLFCLFILWALLPDEYIVWLGVEWYPSREWTLLLPAYSIVLVLLTYFIYFALAISATPAFSDTTTMIDSRAHLGLVEQQNPYVAQARPNAIPELYDIPIGMVNRVAYGSTSRQNFSSMFRAHTGVHAS